MEGVSFGNCGRNPIERNGWIVGRFIEEDTNRRTRAVEIKWGIHRQGQKNEKVVANKTATSISVILSGRFRLTFRENDEVVTRVLEDKGDYAVWGPNVYHDWEAETDCEILTVRWPSVEDDQVALDQTEAGVPIPGGRSEAGRAPVSEA